MPNNPKTGCLTTMRKFIANTAGVAMIEFAFLAPLLVLMALGTFEVGRSIVVHKRFQRAVAMVGDLVAREQFLGTTNTEAQAELAGIVRAAEHVMWPYDAAPLKIAVMQIFAPQANPDSTTVKWTFQHNAAPVATCGTLKAMPSSGMIVGNTYAILIEAEYQYAPAIKNIIPFNWTSRPFKDTVANAPRNNCVEYASRACSSACP
jgi:Flp pilus assembly protein TadG